MAPYAPSIELDKKDGFIKKSVRHMVYRPKSFITKDYIRQQNNKAKEGDRVCK